MMNQDNNSLENQLINGRLTWEQSYNVAQNIETIELHREISRRNNEMIDDLVNKVVPMWVQIIIVKVICVGFLVLMGLGVLASAVASL